MEKKKEKIAVKRKKIDISDIVYGKIPPQDIEAEKAVLGAILFEKSVFTKVEKYLRTPDVFYVEAHRLIYKAIVDCMEAYNECDIIIVSNQLRKEGNLELVGGAYYVTELSTPVTVESISHAITHSLILHEKYISRELIRCCSDIVKKAFNDDGDVFVSLDETLEILDDVKVNISAMKNIDFKEQITDTMKSIEDAAKSESVGLRTGLSNVDRITGGRVKGELTLVAARPSMGKTARMIQEAMNMAFGMNTRVGIISMEMTHRQIITRILSNMAKINSQNIRAGRMQSDEWKKLLDVSDTLRTKNFFINDSSNLTATDIRGIIRNWVEVEKVEIVFIDYIGLIKYSNMKASPNEEVTKISRGLKTIAVECNIPIVALAQLNREVEKRSDKRPNMSDIRDSGSLEQDADTISFLYRPEYYGILQDENGESTANICEENIAKNRNGMVGRVWHEYIKETNTFTEHNEVKIKFPTASEQVAAVSKEEIDW